MKTRVAIFENEFDQLRASFEAVNLLFFNGDLEYESYNTSQDFGPIDRINEYDHVIVDIDLSPRSKLDGYQIIERLLQIDQLRPRIIVLTGHINIEQQLDKRGLPRFPVITKPIYFEKIREALLS